MVIRKFGSVGAAMLLTALTTLVIATPAQAVTTTTYSVSYAHAQGALAVSVTGEIRWLNRSVTLSAPVTLVVNQFETGDAVIDAWSGENWRGTWYSGARTAGSSDTTFQLTGATFDGSNDYGGINKIVVTVCDLTHSACTGRLYNRP